MKILCLGTVINILNFASLPAVRMNKMVTAMFAAFDIDVQDDTQIGHVKSGSNNITAFEDVYKTDFKTTNPKVYDFISRFIQASHKPTVVRAIKSVLLDDEDISCDDVIGYQNQSGYTKREILAKTNFNFTDLLTNVIYYTIAKNNNNKNQAAVKEITKDFYTSCETGESITIIDEYRGSTTSLSTTVNDGHFDDVFLEVPVSSHLNINYPNSLKTFHLHVGSNKFFYKDIKDFIKDNLSHYIFSRARVNSYDSTERMAIDAWMELNKKSIDKNRFSEIMLYAFLEHSLNAPKLMSKIEVEGRSSNSTGIHFLSSINDSSTSHQLIFGSSETLNNITEAIDSVFNQISIIDDNADAEVSLVDNIIFEKPFDNETYEYLKATIIPNKTNGSSRPENSYSAFIGYTISINGTFNNRAEYTAAIESKMKIDIQNVIPYIQNKIANLNLQNHSFYFYFLPLNDAEKDKIEIMKL